MSTKYGELQGRSIAHATHSPTSAFHDCTIMLEGGKISHGSNSAVWRHGYGLESVLRHCFPRDYGIAAYKRLFLRYSV